MTTGIRKHIFLQLEELRVALEGIETLSALIPYCSTCELNIVIPADTAAMQKVTAGVTELLAGKHWPKEEILEVDPALQEALVNSIRHGCGNDPQKEMQCCVTFLQLLCQTDNVWVLKIMSGFSKR